VTTATIDERVQTFGDATWQALGTTALVLTTDPAKLGPARCVVERELAEIDLAASRFREDSEVSRLAAAGGRAVPVSPLLAAAIGAALRAARLTGGAVDPTVGAALADLGYDRDFAELPGSVEVPALAEVPGPAELPVSAEVPALAEVPGPAELPVPAAGWHRAGRRPAPGRVTVRRLPSWRAVELDVVAGTVRVPAGTVIDLGATAKAFAADRAARRQAAEAAGCGVLVSLGGDVAVAGPAPAAGWRVLVTDDHTRAEGGQLVTVRSGGLATSSTTVRRWQRAGREMHHLIDPMTCAPVDGPWRTVSVAAGSCLDANVASTATVVLGERGLPWLARTGLPGRLVARDGTVHLVGAWPQGNR
jgi:thiamine biosynthesis lipoprotein